MRGKVGSFSDADGRGTITGDDGQSYTLDRGDIVGGKSVGPATAVDFHIDGTRAVEVVVLAAEWRSRWGELLSYFSWG